MKSFHNYQKNQPNIFLSPFCSFARVEQFRYNELRSNMIQTNFNIENLKVELEDKHNFHHSVKVTSWNCKNVLKHLSKHTHKTIIIMRHTCHCQCQSGFVALNQKKNQNKLQTRFGHFNTLFFLWITERMARSKGFTKKCCHCYARAKKTMNIEIHIKCTN